MINSVQWSRVDEEPVLAVAPVRFVEINGRMYYTNDTTWGETARPVLIDGRIYVQPKPY